MNLSLPILLTFVLYIIIIYAIGLVATRYLKSLSDFVLADRRLNGPLTALGAGASDMSAWLLMTLPGLVLTFGMNQFWLPLGLIIGAYLNWQFVAKRLRVYTEYANNALTIPSYLNNRFLAKREHGMRITTSLVVILFFTFYAAAGFVAGAQLTESTFHLPYKDALMLSAVVIIIYTMMGGFIAVNWIDFFQGTLVFISLLVVPIVTFNYLGGYTPVLDWISKERTGFLDVMTDFEWIGIISLLSWSLGYFGQPHILSRFMAIRSYKEVPLAQLICMVWMILALYGAVWTGLVGMVYFHANPLHKADMVFIELSKELFNPWITGVLLAAVLSTTMSSVTAQLLASSSALVEDIYHAIFRKKASDKELIFASRMSVLIIALIAVCLAANPANRILTLVKYAWAGLGATFGPVILISLYWKRMTRKAAVAGLISSAITVIVWDYLGETIGGIFKIYEMLPAVIVNIIVIVMVSLLDKKPSKEIENVFTHVKKVLAQET